MKSFIPFLLFTISATITPGPNNFMLMNAGLQFGIKKSMRQYFGVCLGIPLMILIVALGFGAIFIKYIWLQKTFKIIGSLYMLFLAYQIATSHNKPKSEKTTNPISFSKAILIQWVNPKVWLMAISTIAIFVFSTHPLFNALIISALCFLICLPSLALWLCFGAVLQRFLKEENHRRWFNYTMAACLVASIILIFIE